MLWLVFITSTIGGSKITLDWMVASDVIHKLLCKDKKSCLNILFQFLYAERLQRGTAGLQYKKLAPKYDFFMKWKETHDNDYYIKCFNEQVLSKLDFYSVYEELHAMADTVASGDYEICLICFEKPTDFCHRHLVANWFNQNLIACEEIEV